MKTLVKLLLLLGLSGYAADFEFVVSVPKNNLDRLILRVIEEACRAAGSSVNYLFDTDPEALELMWSYPETAQGDWRPVLVQVLGGFGGLVSLRATEEDLNQLLTVKNLATLKGLPLEASFQTSDPWLVHWQRAGLPFRIDNTTPNQIRRGQYRLVPIWQLSLESENSAIPLRPLGLLLRINTDLAIYARGTNVSPTRLEAFRRTLESGLGILKENRRLDFVIRQWFLVAFREFQIQKLTPVIIAY